MKRYVLFLLLLFNLLGARAQQVTPVYFNGETIINSKDYATSYAVYGKLSTENLWVFKRYDLYDNLIQTGSYNDETLSTPHGRFVFYEDVDVFNRIYNTNFNLKEKYRFKSQQGDFVNGVEHGRWLLFFPDGNVMNSKDFVNGKLNGEFVTYDKLGNVVVKGNYVDGERDGEWIFEKGKQKAVYDKGVLKSSFDVNKPGHSKIPASDRATKKMSTSTTPLPNPNRKHEMYQDISLFNVSHGTNFSTTNSKMFLSEQGNLVNNLEEGTWLVFYPDGKTLSSRNYVKGNLNGEFISYDISGEIVEKGNYVNNIKHGMWIEKGTKQVYYDKGKIKAKPKN